MPAEPGNVVWNGNMAGIFQIPQKPAGLGDAARVPQLQGTVLAAPTAVARKTIDGRSINIPYRDMPVGSPLQEMPGGAEGTSRQVGILRNVSRDECLVGGSPGGCRAAGVRVGGGGHVGVSFCG